MEDFENILYQKLSIAESLFKLNLSEFIDTISLLKRQNRLKIVLKDYNTLIFIQYNPYNMHTRNRKEVQASPMIGDPEKNIPILIKLVKKST